PPGRLPAQTTTPLTLAPSAAGPVEDGRDVPRGLRRTQQPAESAAEEYLGLLVAAGRHLFEAVQGGTEVRCDDLGAAQRGHMPPGPIMDQVQRIDAEPGGQDAVEAGRVPTALNVSQSGVAGFDAGAFLTLLGHPFADAAQPWPSGG